MNRSGHSRHKSHSQSVQCTRPSYCLRQRWRHNPIQLRDVTIATQRTLLRELVNGTEIILKSTDRRSNLSRFLYVQGLMHGYLMVYISKVIRLNCFSKMWRISLPLKLQNNDIQWKLKTAGWSQTTTFQSALDCPMHCVQCTLEKQCTANHVINNIKSKVSDFFIRIR